MMTESVNKIEMVVGGLLNFSRKHEFKLIPISLKNAVENSLFLASFQLERQKITLLNNVINETPPILGSLNHLEQVVLNLVINSIDAIVEKKKFLPDFKGEIKIYFDYSSDSVFLYIQDNGAGISNENQKFVFEPFYTTKVVGAGTGLGLSISENIIEQHNGSISMKSSIAEGTTVKLTFPIIQNFK
jgi:two-component system NtrC family sensor kinase